MIPSYYTLIVIATDLAIATAVWGVLSWAAARSGLDRAARRGVQIGSGVFIGAWLGAALLLAPSPSSPIQDPFYVTPLIPWFVVTSLAIALLAIRRSASLRTALAAVPLPTLHALQVWRIFGVVFIVQQAQGLLPAGFGLPAGWGDLVVGLTAAPLALALERRLRRAHVLAAFWNVFGLLDLVVAIGTGTGVLVALLGLGPRVPAAAAMAAFPMFLVPAFAVPMSTLIHVLALAALRRETRLTRPLAPAPAH
jgi:hypothetical protein